MKSAKRQAELPAKRQIAGSNGQFYVRVNGKEEWREILRWLGDSGFENVHKLTEDTIPNRPNIVVIDKSEKWFGATNITCMACSATRGYYAINFTELLELY